MKLSFECTRDLRTMPTTQGKKFCANCQKHVTDLRRKSDEKIVNFFEANPNPCVIIYQNQLDKLPKRLQKKKSEQFRYFPYAAGIIAVSLLPTLTMAQVDNKPALNIIGTVPVYVPTLSTENINTNDSIAPEKQVYYVTGKIRVRNKLLMSKQGKRVSVHCTLEDSLNGRSYNGMIGMDKLDENGKFSMEITKEEFDIISDSKSELWVDVSRFNSEEIKRTSVTKNKLKLVVSVSARRGRRVMGKF